MLVRYNLLHNQISRGTMNMMVESQLSGGMVRQNGVLTTVAVAWKTRTIDFGDGPVQAKTTLWCEVAVLKSCLATAL